MDVSKVTQHINGDRSVEHSVDWDSFSFESELETRKNVLTEESHVLKCIAESTVAVRNDEYIIKQLQANTNVYHELLKNNENTLSKSDTLVAELKKIKQIVESLMAENSSLERTIKRLEEEEASTNKEYQLYKKALSKALETYTTYFDVDVAIKSLSDTTYEASLQIGKGKNGTPIKFVIDRTHRKVLDYDGSEVLSSPEEENLRKRFGDLDNLPGLLCTLREIALNKENIVK